MEKTIINISKVNLTPHEIVVKTPIRAARKDFKWLCDNEKEFLTLHKPIELSERWFVDLQFEVLQEGWYVKNKAFPSSEYWDFTWNIYDKELRWKGYILPVKYVHELQNLYFAITGKELELRENFGR